jgi:sigma-E factor negative regulatory protein RseB
LIRFAIWRSNTPMKAVLVRGMAYCLCWCGLLNLGLIASVEAQARPSAAPVSSLSEGVAERSVTDWLLRMHEASRRRTYAGTFVVSVGGALSSSRISHICDGDQQLELVESLTGAPRSILRRNDQVVTFLPDSRVVVIEERESLGLFPNLLTAGGASIAQHYRVHVSGRERVAGFEADVVQLRPNDALRFGYRVWIERRTGLMVKLQILDGTGHVLEQSAFSELQLDMPLSAEKLIRMMANTAGFQVERPDIARTTAGAEGWVLKSLVPGFEAVSCYRRPVGRAAVEARSKNTVQWVFSDGLASVSLFVEAFDSRLHRQTSRQALGATHTITQRIGGWWLTAVGEVPYSTLEGFARGLERTK